MSPAPRPQPSAPLPGPAMLARLINRLTRRPPDTPLAEAHYVVLDTELSGLDRRADAILAIGAVRMQGSRILLSETFEQLVDPGRDLRRENVLVHQLTPGELAGQPGIAAALDRLAAFIGEAVLVGHFVHLDLSFINRDLGRPLPNPHLDTLLVHRWIEWQHRNYLGAAAATGDHTATTLPTLAQAYGIEVPGVHHALTDAFVTAQLWQRQLSRLAALGVRTVRDALAVTRA